MGFEFITAPRIVFEWGAVKKLPGICAGLGKRCLVVTGGSSLRRSGVLNTLLEGLADNGVHVTLYDRASGEPTLQTVDAAVERGRSAGVDVVLGIGGGSAMDTAKAAAGVIPNAGSVRDYLEGVGTAKITENPLPFIAAPTTAGTGSEVTKNAVIMSKEDKFKVSIRDDRMMARVAVVDSELTVSVPPDVTAASGMDALCQLIESFTTALANPMCDALALYYTPRAMEALRRAYDDGSDRQAREMMSLAAMVSGMCLANSGLGAAHGIGAGLGAVLGVLHGVACGMLLPHVMRYNAAHGVLKYAQLALAVCGRHYASDEDGARAVADAVAELALHLKLPVSLRELGVTEANVDELAAASMGSSMKKNPVPFTLDECRDFLLSLI
ncbi:MAG: iron-containing alcohol dehydrogenase [Christensenellales bacterium]|jgi:alcohol dehydrogenase class IV